MTQRLGPVERLVAGALDGRRDDELFGALCEDLVAEGLLYLASQDPHYEVASEGGGLRAAAMYTLIGTAKLNGLIPRPGSPTCSGASPSTQTAAYTNCCPGTGRTTPCRSPPDPIHLRQA